MVIQSQNFYKEMELYPTAYKIYVDKKKSKFGLALTHSSMIFGIFSQSNIHITRTDAQKGYMGKIRAQKDYMRKSVHKRITRGGPGVRS